MENKEFLEILENIDFKRNYIEIFLANNQVVKTKHYFDNYSHYENTDCVYFKITANDFIRLWETPDNTYCFKAEYITGWNILPKVSSN